jgi:hypothetical protein
MIHDQNGIQTIEEELSNQEPEAVESFEDSPFEVEPQYAGD